MLRHVSGQGETLRELRDLRESMATCYGPHGRVALLQPVAGGHVTITNQSGKMVQLMDSSNPVHRVLTGSLSTHSQRYKDGTKLASLLTINIVLNCLALDPPRRQVADVIDDVLIHCMEALQSPPLLITCDWSSVSNLMSVTRTLLSSHPLSFTFNDEELNHLSSILLQAFLHVAVPSNSKGEETLSLQDKIHIYLISEIQCPLIRFYKGILLEENHSIGFDREMTLPLSDHVFKRDGHGRVLVAVFRISLAGDEEDGFKEKVSFEVPVSSRVSSRLVVEEAKKMELLELGSAIGDNGIGLVLCQKRVHHSLRDYLEEKGIVVIERLGLPYIESVVDLTGGHVINFIKPEIPPHLLGYVNDVTMETIGERRFIFLEGPSSHATIVLPYLLEVVGEELKSVVKSTIGILEDLLYNPQLVSGGGCVLTQLAGIITRRADCISEEVIREKLMTSKRAYFEVCNALSTSFKQSAAALYYNKNDCIILSDSRYNHCWSFPYTLFPHIESSKTCSCGRISLGSLQGELEASTWSTINSWRGLPSLVPEALLETTCISESSSAIASSLFLSDSHSHTIAALALTKSLSTLIVRTHSTLM